MVVRRFVEGLESKLSFAALKSLAEEEKEEQLLWLSLNCPDVLKVSVSDGGARSMPNGVCC